MKSKRELKDILESRKALFKRKPEAAIYKPKVTTQWKGGLLHENSIRDHIVESDYPVPSGGSDKAANPMELVLASLGSCVSAVYIEYAVLMGVTLDSVTVETEGVIDLRGLFSVADDVPSGFESITYNVTIKSGEGKDAIDKLIAVAESHCPVSDSLKRSVTVKSNVEVVSG